jgi:hypothetical protein
MVAVLTPNYFIFQKVSNTGISIVVKSKLKTTNIVTKNQDYRPPLLRFALRGIVNEQRRQKDIRSAIVVFFCMSYSSTLTTRECIHKNNQPVE